MSAETRSSSDMRGVRILSGVGLHSGERCSAELVRSAGPVRFVHDDCEVPVASLHVLRTDRGVQVSAPHARFCVDLVEHFFAALGGLGIRRDVTVSVRGPELPLLDGAALAWATALRELSLPTEAPTLRVARRAELSHGEASYRFEPGAFVGIDITVEFDGFGKQEAHWDGTATSFVRDIAPARTFGFRHEWPDLRARGRARGVDPQVVMVLDAAGRVEPPGTLAGPNELARHKLLDLIGDFYVYGGPPLGKVVAFRPGHGATHAVIARAIAHGILVGPTEC